jgi:hypothetical protein
MQRGADELVVVEEEKVGIEDLGLALTRGACNVISGGAELGPNRFKGGVESLGLSSRRAGRRFQWGGDCVR